jgi:hypothetical protein
MSGDGHLYNCRNPASMRQAFHVYVVFFALFTLLAINTTPVFLLSIGLLALHRLMCHGIIVIPDRSSSMSGMDRQPLQGTPTTRRIATYANNRLGAVYSALFAFWTSRQAAVERSGLEARQDAYSMMLFNQQATVILENDFNSSPDALLDLVLPHRPSFGTNFDVALLEAQRLMERHWSDER